MRCDCTSSDHAYDEFGSSEWCYTHLKVFYTSNLTSLVSCEKCSYSKHANHVSNHTVWCSIPRLVRVRVLNGRHNTLFSDFFLNFGKHLVYDKKHFFSGFDQNWHYRPLWSDSCVRKQVIHNTHCRHGCWCANGKHDSEDSYLTVDWNASKVPFRRFFRDKHSICFNWCNWRSRCYSVRLVDVDISPSFFSRSPGKKVLEILLSRSNSRPPGKKVLGF